MYVYIHIMSICLFTSSSIVFDTYNIYMYVYWRSGNSLKSQMKGNVHEHHSISSLPLEVADVSAQGPLCPYSHRWSYIFTMNGNADARGMCISTYIYFSCFHIDCSILQHCSPCFASMHHQAYQTVLYFELLNEVAPLQLPNAQLHDMRWCPCWCFPHISAWRSHKVTPKDDKHN